MIELLIVVAIIGILAAIALPQYQQYVVKGKWASNIASLDSLKLGIGVCLQENGNDPTKCSTAALLNLTALPTLKYATGAVTLTAGAVGSGNLTIAYTGTADAGGYVYTAMSTPDASGTTTAWVKTAADTIPATVMDPLSR
jgi:type IV pilus assembly protein PilA